MEWLSPSFRDSVLDLVLDSGFVWTLCESSGQGLLMKLIKLIVELGNHLLNISTLFLSVEFLEYCRFDFLFVNHALVNERDEGLFRKDISNFSILVMREELYIGLVYL